MCVLSVCTVKCVMRMYVRITTCTYIFRPPPPFYFAKSAPVANIIVVKDLYLCLSESVCSYSVNARYFCKLFIKGFRPSIYMHVHTVMYDDQHYVHRLYVYVFGL